MPHQNGFPLSQERQYFFCHVQSKKQQTTFTSSTTTAKLAVFHSEPLALIMQEYKKFICVICGFIYDEALGWPEEGIAAGTLWDDVPENWFCPDCGAAKEDFEMMEIAS